MWSPQQSGFGQIHFQSDYGDDDRGKGSRATPHGRGGVGVAARQTLLRCTLLCCCLSRKRPAAMPLPESLQPPCNSPPCESPQRESFEGASPVVFRGSFKRGLSGDDIQERMSSCSQNVTSPTIRVATPETPSAAAPKRGRSDDGGQCGTCSDVSSAAYKAKDRERNVWVRS